MDKLFAIMADITCDLDKKLQEEFDCEVIHSHYVTPDGVEHESVLDWTNFSREEFYNDLKKNPNGYKTSAPNIDECYVAFEKHIKEGRGVIALTISSALSGTYSFMMQAKKRILEKYNDAKIEVVDSMRFGPALGLICVNASLKRSKGESFEEVVKWINENKCRFHQTGWMDDLSFVAKKGRISNAKAFFGSLVGIKPIGEFDYNGLTTVIGKAKGEKMAYKVLADYMGELIENPSEQIIFIATSNRHKQAEIFKDMIIERFHPKAVYVNDVYPNCGINVGPGLMAAYYFGKEISKDLVEEKRLISEIIEKNK